jgi:hypothetical protein
MPLLPPATHPIRPPPVAATDDGGAPGRAASERVSEARYATKTAWPPGSNVRRYRATGVQAARRHPGEVAARRRRWMTAHFKMSSIRRATPAHTIGAGAFRAARIPIRTPAVAATGYGRRNWPRRLAVRAERD